MPQFAVIEADRLRTGFKGVRMGVAKLKCVRRSQYFISLIGYNDGLDDVGGPPRSWQTSDVMALPLPYTICPYSHYLPRLSPNPSEQPPLWPRSLPRDWQRSRYRHYDQDLCPAIGRDDDLCQSRCSDLIWVKILVDAVSSNSEIPTPMDPNLIRPIAHTTTTDHTHLFHKWLLVALLWRINSPLINSLMSWVSFQCPYKGISLYHL